MRSPDRRAMRIAPRPRETWLERKLEADASHPGRRIVAAIVQAFAPFVVFAVVLALGFLIASL